jgi:hypothetical protein
VLPVILRALERYDVVSTGRYGAWGYGSMETALRQGREAARPAARAGPVGAGRAR